MLITKRKSGIFTILNIFFAEEPVTDNLPECDVVMYCTHKNWGAIKGFDRIKSYQLTIDLQPQIDSIWNKMHRHNKRHIRRAEKNGTTVTASNNFDEFHQMYKKYLKEKNHADPLGLYALSSQFMQKYGTLFFAENNGEILGGYLYIHDKNNARLVNIAYQNIGNDAEQKKRIYDANCYLHWEAMRYFKNLDIVRYALGMLNCDEIYANRQMSGGDYFKRKFGGEVVPEYNYVKFNSQVNKVLYLSYNHFRNYF